MGCYGLGVSRILAASVEVLGKDNNFRWPLLLAPYKIVLIVPKVQYIFIYDLICDFFNLNKYLYNYI